MTRTLSTHTRTLHPLTLTLVAGTIFSFAQTAGAGDLSPGQQAVETAARQNQYAFIMFYRANDAATQGMHRTLKSALSQRQDAAIIPIQVNDAAERGLVARFDASRTPMPAIVALAPNGAVTGVFPRRVSSAHLTAAITSPGQAQCLKALQDKKIVLLCVQPEGNNVVPEGVRQFQADELYKDRTEVVNVQANDPAEARFLQQLKLRTDQPTAVTAFMAPPGVMLGTFDANVTHDVLAQKLAAAGKCCEDPNCKHHKSAGKGQPTRR